MSSLVPALHPASIAQLANLKSYLDAAASAGFQAADFNMGQARDLASASGIDAVVSAFASRGIQAGGWGAGVQALMSQSDFDAALLDAETSAELGAALNAKACSVLVPNRTDLPREEALDLFAVRLGDIADTLAGHGVSVSLEFIGPNLWPDRPHGFISGIRGTLDLIERVGRVNVGILFDTYHYYCGDSQLEDIITAGSVINHVHLNDAPAGNVGDLDDSMRQLPGEGILDLAGIAAALDAAGYEGPGGVEIFSDDLRRLPAHEGAATVAAACHRVFGSP
jgi:sugar phosphate isomerase/epimerase